MSFLTPRMKAKKYYVELVANQKITNDFDGKVDRKGNPIKLNYKERAYRAGYLDRGRDNFKLYKYHSKRK